eukprot:snap_masked-scaffold_5-processed-gene-9.17-mRNA-1 protein AED:1.00 eAED:1.00 QI:0/-1/0/0/-1/1/1/0/152
MKQIEFNEIFQDATRLSVASTTYATFSNLIAPDLSPKHIVMNTAKMSFQYFLLSTFFFATKSAVKRNHDRLVSKDIIVGYDFSNRKTIFFHNSFSGFFTGSVAGALFSGIRSVPRTGLVFSGLSIIGLGAVDAFENWKKNTKQKLLKKRNKL